MKVGLVTTKTISNDLLALILACLMSMVFTQSSAQFHKPLHASRKTDSSVARNPHEKSNGHKSKKKSNVGMWMAAEAVLKSSDPIFQARDDSRFLFIDADSQIVTLIKLSYSSAIDNGKALSINTLSIPIFHCQLLI